MAEELLVNNAINGMLWSALACLIVLIIATNNYILSLVSVVCVLGVVSSSLAICYYLGWSLGFVESIAACMVIGLSVDYTIHLCNAY